MLAVILAGITKSSLTVEFVYECRLYAKQATKIKEFSRLVRVKATGSNVVKVSIAEQWSVVTFQTLGFFAVDKEPHAAQLIF